MPIITIKIPPMLNSHIRPRNAFIQGRAWLGMHVSKPKFGISFGEKFITLISTKWKKGRSVAYSSTGPSPSPPVPLQWRSTLDSPRSLNPQTPFLDHVPMD